MKNWPSPPPDARSRVRKRNIWFPKKESRKIKPMLKPWDDMYKGNRYTSDVKSSFAVISSRMQYSVKKQGVNSVSTSPPHIHTYNLPLLDFCQVGFVIRLMSLLPLIWRKSLVCAQDMQIRFVWFWWYKF